MDRKEFLSMLGAGAAALIASPYLNGCGAAGNPVAAAVPTKVDFTLDLGARANAALIADGGYVYNTGVIVARVSADTYVAVSSTCTHQGGTVYFTNGDFYCPLHGSLFTANGARIAGPANAPLTQYKTALTGSSLRVYS